MADQTPAVETVFYSLPAGSDGDEFWNFHTRVHGVNLREAAGSVLLSYVGSRVTKWKSGDYQLFAYVTLHWESQQAMIDAGDRIRLIKGRDGMTEGQEFWSRVSGACNAWAEEYVVKDDRSEGEQLIKDVATYSAPMWSSGDGLWHFHTREHAPEYMEAAGPGLARYVISRITKVISGEPRFYMWVETYWRSADAMYKAGEAARTTKFRGGLSLAEDFASRVNGKFEMEVAEHVIKQRASPVHV